MSGPEEKDQMTKSPRLRRAGQVVLGLALPLIVAGCASNAPQDSLKPQGKYAREIDDLFKPVFLVAGVVFVLVELAVLVAVIRFRRRSDDEDLPEDFPEQV